MAADTWASLPCDLLIEILRRLASNAVIRCAGACRPWRRTIVGNASSLGPRPSLLIGFFHSNYVHHRASSPIADMTSYTTLLRACSPSPDAPLFVPAGFALYRNPLSSRGGFVLLDGGPFAADLCLCNPMVGSCRLLPAATAAGDASYVLVTGHDVVCTDDGSAVWILAVKREENVGAGVGMAYRIFSSASGEWGPAKRSARLELEEGRTHAYRYGKPVVCRGGAVYFLGEMHLISGGRRAFAFAIDVRGERTWTTELPEKYAVLYYHRASFSLLSLATFGDDGQLSLVVSLPSRQIEVWVFVGDGQWMLRRKIDVPELIPEYCKTAGPAWLRTYCYSSGCLFVDVDERDVVIAVDEDLPCPIKQIDRGRVSSYPYEMDWLTYVSKMKYF